MKQNIRPRSHSESLCSSRETGEGKHGFEHQPVLLSEVINGLNIKTEGVYVDATFGRGGHSKAILERLGASGRLYVFDKDMDAVNSARMIKDERLGAEHGSFTLLKERLAKANLIGKIDGIMLDLGVSSPQLDDPQRGFSFLRDGPLDMRMDLSQRLDAKTWINNASERELAGVIKEYGEERFARRIAVAIVMQRVITPIETTLQLAEIVAGAVPTREKKKHPATRTFQAIRIFINNELHELKEVLKQCLEVLALNGRLAVISFHSLEDRIVKRFIQQQSATSIPAEIPIRADQCVVSLRRIGSAVRASDAEVKDNPRSRSAVLRIAEKIA